jgi:GR25 family glycosyltransferase involved in LPS biosynthesis
MTVPQIQVINLNRRKDRKRSFLKKNLAYKENIKFVEAVDGTKLKVKHRQKTNGRAACYLSHQKCWLHIAHGLETFGIVAEDDVEINNALMKDIEDIKKQMKEKDVDYLILHWTPKRNVPKPGTAQKLDIKPVSGVFHGCHLQIITKTGAQKLLENDSIDPLGDTPVDIALGGEEIEKVGDLRVFLAESDKVYGYVKPGPGDTEDQVAHQSSGKKLTLSLIIGLVILLAVVLLLMGLKARGMILTR